MLLVPNATTQAARDRQDCRVILTSINWGCHCEWKGYEHIDVRKWRIYRVNLPRILLICRTVHVYRQQLISNSENSK